MQPEIPFSTTCVKNLKWFGQELTELFKEKSNDKERLFIYGAIDPKCQGDLQDHMIFYMTSKLRGVFDKFEDNIDDILIPNRKVWSTLLLETLTYCVRVE